MFEVGGKKGTGGGGGGGALESTSIGDGVGSADGVGLGLGEPTARAGAEACGSELSTPKFLLESVPRHWKIFN